MVGRLEVRLVPHHLPELSGLPAGLLRVERRVEDEAMDMKVGVRNPVHGSRCEVGERAPDQVAGLEVLVAVAESDPGMGARLELAHGLRDRRLHGLHDPGVPGQGVEHRYPLWCVEREVVADRAVIPCPGGEPLAGQRVEIVAETGEGLLIEWAGSAALIPI